MSKVTDTVSLITETRWADFSPSARSHSDIIETSADWVSDGIKRNRAGDLADTYLADFFRAKDVEFETVNGQGDRSRPFHLYYHVERLFRDFIRTELFCLKRVWQPRLDRMLDGTAAAY